MRKIDTKTVYIPLWGNRIIRLEKWLSEQAAQGWIVEKIDLRFSNPTGRLQQLMSDKNFCVG